MFASCASLTKVTSMGVNTKTVTQCDNMFQSCVSLEEAPLFDTSNVGAMTSMFFNCLSLKIVPPYNTSVVTDMPSFVSQAYSVTKILTPIRRSTTIANLKLSADALNELFTILPTVTGQTLTITGNPGASDPATNRSIATAKGWTITG